MIYILIFIIGCLFLLISNLNKMIKVYKRDGTTEIFNKKKIYNAVLKSSINSKYGVDSQLAHNISDIIEDKIIKREIHHTISKWEIICQTYLLK